MKEVKKRNSKEIFWRIIKMIEIDFEEIGEYIFIICVIIITILHYHIVF